MAEDQKITPKLSERFSDLFGVDEFASEPDGDDQAYSGYLEESRKLNLNKLLHLAPYSEVLLLLGAPGVGRTALLNAFMQRAATTWRVGYIKANAQMDGSTFLHQIAEGLELDLGEAQSVDDLLWEIDRYLQALGRGGRRAIIIIDDAHLLTDDVFLLAEKILRDERTEDAVSLVVSMRRDQGDKLKRFALLAERLAYTIVLEPLTRSEVDGYLRHCLASAGAQFDQLLTPEMVTEIYRESRGLPEQINTRARELLLKQQKRPVTTATPAGPTADVNKKRPVWAISGVVLVAVVAGVVLFYQDEINRLLKVPEQPVMQQQAAAPVPQSKAVDEREEETPDKPIAGALPPLEDESGQPIDLALPEEDVVAEVERTPPTEQLELGTVAEPGPVTAEPVEPGAVAEAPQAAPEEARPEPPARPTPEPEPKEPPKPKLSPQMEWLMVQPGDNYTMQLMALANKADVMEFIDAHGIADQFATFAITRRGKELTVLVYGSYPSRAAASRAAADLPRAWGVGQPWIRKFAGIHEELASR